MKQTFAILALILLGACSSSGALIVADDSPFAPPTRGASSVPQMEVGHRLMEAQQYELALRAFKRAAAEEGLTTDVLMGLGTANLGLGRLGQAENQLRDAYEKDQTSPDILNNLGVVLMEQGKTVEAAQLFRKAFALDNGNSVEIRDNLRLALAKIDDRGYNGTQEEPFQLVRQGTSDYLIEANP